jgi:hypothetical protein
MANPTLVTSRYTEPSVYVGEILNPENSNLSADARLPAIIAAGSRLALAPNVPIIRAFISAAPLTFTHSPPYTAPLPHFATGAQALPNRIFKQDGTQLTQNQWNYLTDGNGNFNGVQISNQVFDSLATYYMDFQSSDRKVRDQIPIADIRQLRAVGNQTNSPQYVEYEDFYVPMSFTAVAPNPDNTNPEPFFSAVTATLQAGSTGAVQVDDTAEYTGVYNRLYTISCLSVSGVSPNRVATFSWTATNLSPGNNVQPPVPLHSTAPAPQFTVQESEPLTETQDLELGVVLDFAFGGTNFVSGDAFVLTANGGSLVEVDARYDNPQYATIVAPAFISGTANGLLIQTDPKAAYTNARNNNYRLKLLSVSGTTPNRLLTFVWARFGDVNGVSGTFVVNEAVPASLTVTLIDGVILDFIIGVTSPAAGSIWQVQAQAPRLYYTAKDTRQYTLNFQAPSTVGSVTSISGGFTTDTTEGRFGTFSASFDSSAPVLAASGYAVLPDNISVAFRNLPNFAALDIFTFGVIDSDLIDWSLDVVTTDTRQLTDFQTDMNGQVTGTAGQQYVVLSYVPTAADSIQVTNYSTHAQISFNWVIGQPFVYFTAPPGVPINISYEHLAPQPDPGEAYYMTVLFLRPVSMYNVPFLVLSQTDGRSYASPMTIGNDLYVGDEILWGNGGVGAYLIQPQNLDGSGIYSVPDFTAAIQSIRSYDRITDLCLLNFPAGLPVLLEENLLANDPFEQRPNLIWFGPAIGTPIGDENTEGSLVQLSTQTLQAPPQSAALGTRILAGATMATLAVVLDGGQTVTLTLDGSFVALAGAARVASFADPATDLLGQPISGFATIQIYTKTQIGLLGQAQVLYVKGSSGAYTWGEDYTVDQTTGFNRIQLMTQRSFVTKVVSRDMQAVIGIVPSSGTAAQALIQGELASILRGLLSKGLVGPYQDASGNERSFNPDTDILVYEDTSDDTLFYFNYAWFSRNVIKRLFGLYALNNNDFSTGVALQ